MRGRGKIILTKWAKTARPRLRGYTTNSDKLPVAGHAQKELFHNEAAGARCGGFGSSRRGALATPPPSPVVGSSYIFVGSNPTGRWSAHAGKLAFTISGGWRFVALFDGLSALVRSSGTIAVYRNGAWEIGELRGSEVIIDGLKVVGTRAAAITAPAGGSAADREARAAIGAILTALRAHGLIET